MACCGRGAKPGTVQVYEVTCRNGHTETVADMPSVRRVLASNSGGTWKAVAKPAPK